MNLSSRQRIRDRHPRLLWIVNHKTLMDVEVSIFNQAGFSVFIPKRVPNDPGYRSARIEYRFDADLDIPAEALRILNQHEFYTKRWSPTTALIINRYFDCLVTSVSGFTTPFLESINKFEGLIVSRVFGREDPARYTSFFDEATLEAIKGLGSRFIFGQGFGNLAQIEDGRIASRAKTLPLGVPAMVWGRENSWQGQQRHVLLLCPNILDSYYYGQIYKSLKANFGGLPHLIMGRQNIRPDDAAVLPYMTDGELLDLYSRVAVFAYPSVEPRHVHYSPIEAMIIGCPVLYMRSGLLDFLAGQRLPGACENMAEMQAKSQALLAGSPALRDEIISAQRIIVDTFSDSVSSTAWREVLAPIRREVVDSDELIKDGQT